MAYFPGGGISRIVSLQPPRALIVHRRADGRNGLSRQAISGRMGDAEVTEFDLINLILLDVVLQANHILSPIDVGVRQDVTPAIRPAGDLIEVGEIVGIDAQRADDAPGQQQQ